MQTEKPHETELKPVECPVCEQVNAVECKFCTRCGHTLSVENAVNADEKRKELAEYVMDLVEQDPRIMKLFRNLK